jgi:hypothetical protein
MPAKQQDHDRGPAFGPLAGFEAACNEKQSQTTVIQRFAGYFKFDQIKSD